MCTVNFNMAMFHKVVPLFSLSFTDIHTQTTIICTILRVFVVRAHIQMHRFTRANIILYCVGNDLTVCFVYTRIL